MFAHTAVAARHHNYLVSLLELRDTMSRLGDNARGFVPRYERERHILSDTFDRFVVRGTDSARPYPHNRFACPRFGLRDLFQLKIVEVLKNSS
jgi:hypothetical protein